MAYSVIILDEAHERTIHSDVLLGIVKQAQAKRKESNSPLRVRSLILAKTSLLDEYLTKISMDHLFVVDLNAWTIDEPIWDDWYITDVCFWAQVIVMSATMDVDHFCKYLNDAPAIYLEGRQFPVEILHAVQPQDDYNYSCLVTIFQINKEAPPK